jgi:hypothetical protein
MSDNLNKMNHTAMGRGCMRARAIVRSKSFWETLQFISQIAGFSSQPFQQPAEGPASKSLDSAASS